MTGFSAVDYAVLLLYLVGITVFGTLFRRSQRTVKDYFLGSKNISWIVISLSIVATETLTLIGVPVLAYSTFARREQGGNLTYLQIVSGYIIARILISVLLIPAYFQGELMTAYEGSNAVRQRAQTLNSACAPGSLNNPPLSLPVIMKFAYRREGEHNGPEVLPYVEDHRCHTPMKMDQSFDCALEARMRVFR